MLNKENRLKRKSDFQLAYKQGRYTVARQMVIYNVRTSPLAPVRVGFVVSKKVGNSPIRSRCKRLMREAMRQFIDDLPVGMDLVVVARPPLAHEEYHGVLKVMAKLLKKGKLLGEENQ